MIDAFKGMYNAAFLKTLVMVVMTLVLNILCKRNFTLIAWLIVFIPFILMTYITSILFFVFIIFMHIILKIKSYLICIFFI